MPANSAGLSSVTLGTGPELPFFPPTAGLAADFFCGTKEFAIGKLLDAGFPVFSEILISAFEGVIRWLLLAELFRRAILIGQPNDLVSGTLTALPARISSSATRRSFRWTRAGSLALSILP